MEKVITYISLLNGEELLRRSKNTLLEHIYENRGIGKYIVEDTADGSYILTYCDGDYKERLYVYSDYAIISYACMILNKMLYE